MQILGIRTSISPKCGSYAYYNIIYVSGELFSQNIASILKCDLICIWNFYFFLRYDPFNPRLTKLFFVTRLTKLFFVTRPTKGELLQPSCELEK